MRSEVPTSSWRSGNDVFVEDAAVDHFQPDDNVVLGWMVLAVAIAETDRRAVCHIRPTWNYTSRCMRCYSWRRRYGSDWDGRLLRFRDEPPRWPLRHIGDLAENQLA
jgi:hypothetical protein